MCGPPIKWDMCRDAATEICTGSPGFLAEDYTGWLLDKVVQGLVRTVAGG